MSPNTPSDVEGHLSNHTRSHIHLMPRATVVSSTPVSADESGNAETNTGNLAVGTLESPTGASTDSDSGIEVSSALSQGVRQ
jgi:hypothetical protein